MIQFYHNYVQQLLVTVAKFFQSHDYVYSITCMEFLIHTPAPAGRPLDLLCFHGVTSG